LFTFEDDSEGNVFKVYDNGQLILTTTLVNGDAYGQAMLPAGAQALTINWVSRGQPGNNADEFSYCINQETLLGLTVWDNSSYNNKATAITNGAVKTLTVAGVPSATDPATLTASVSIYPDTTPNTDTNRVYLSIERQGATSQCDQILYYGPLSQFPTGDWTLSAKSLAADFVILEWVDAKQDGKCDPGDDSREVDVEVVTPWTALGTWTAGKAAMVQANADGASLAQLALDITGNASDASELGNPGNITMGERIDVTPLLNCLEQNLRSNAVAAANYTNKAAGFGSPTETSQLPNWSESCSGSDRGPAPFRSLTASRWRT
jgi:hypothetical protein